MLYGILVCMHGSPEFSQLLTSQYIATHSSAKSYFYYALLLCKSPFVTSYAVEGVNTGLLVSSSHLHSLCVP